MYASWRCADLIVHTRRDTSHTTVFYYDTLESRASEERDRVSSDQPPIGI